MRCAVIMGVTGCGKSDLGAAIDQSGQMGFADGSAFMPPACLEKMAVGLPLTDEDRRPWLLVVADHLRAADGSMAIECSALKRSYRDLLRERVREPIFFLHLQIEAGALVRRIISNGHHVPTSQHLANQFAALEPLEPDEAGATIDADQSPEAVFASAAQALGAAGFRQFAT